GRSGHRSNFCARPWLEALERRDLLSGSDLDLSFGSGGKTTVDVNFGFDWVYGLAQQPHGKIVAAGRTRSSDYDFAPVRLNPNGALDASLGGTGKVITNLGSAADYARGVAVMPDGRIVVAGYTKGVSNYDFAVVRYLPNGTLDTSFGGTGKIVTDLGGDDKAY